MDDETEVPTEELEAEAEADRLGNGGSAGCMAGFDGGDRVDK